jgi:hypothetical protein
MPFCDGATLPCHKRSRPGDPLEETFPKRGSLVTIEGMALEQAAVPAYTLEELRDYPRRHPITAASSTQTNLATMKSVNERYYSRAQLMRRVFAIGVLECPRCQGPMKILAQVHPPDTTRKILQSLAP